MRHWNGEEVMLEKHCIEIADEPQTSGMALKNGDAEVHQQGRN